MCLLESLWFSSNLKGKEKKSMQDYTFIIEEPPNLPAG